MGDKREGWAGPVSVISTTFAETGASARLVFVNPNLRRINLALAGSMIGDNAYGAAVGIYAYNAGGAAAVGAYFAVRLALVAVGLPFLSVWADRFDKRRFLIATDLVRAALVMIVAGVALAGGPALVVLGLATVISLIGAPFRPVQGSLIPSLANNPRELTAGNAVSSTLESLAWFFGPALAGVLLLVASIPVIFAFNAATFVWSALMLTGLRIPVREPSVSGGGSADDESAATGGLLTEAAAGFRAIASDRRLRLIFGLTCAQTVVAGASAVFVVIIALDIVRLGPPGNGYLNAVLGIGSIAGGLIALSRATRGRLAVDFGVGVLLWSAPLVILALVPSPVIAFAVCALLGLANPLVDVNLFTLLQRLAPPALLGRVLAALESGVIGTMALGALLVPILISLVGLRWMFVIIAVPILVGVLLAVPALRRMDAELHAPDTLALVTAQPLFAPLSPAAQESLARQLERLSAEPGTQVITEGEVGDRFYLVESGRLEARRGTEILREMSAGDCFGEIALLRDVPRTASVVATEDSVLWALQRGDFLDAVRGDPESRTRAETLVALRLAH